MDTEQAYNLWSSDYDTVLNRTRDLEAAALRAMFAGDSFDEILEIGCGTGKNTSWLAGISKKVTGADFSAEMIERAKAKIGAENVCFVQMDVRNEWPFPEQNFDLVTGSLMLEHIENLGFVFQQAQKVLKKGGLFYLGELHPFKQYQGSKARFETGGGTFVLECFTHHISDFFGAAIKNGFGAIAMNEWFDDGDRTAAPRILAMKFVKKD